MITVPSPLQLDIVKDPSLRCDRTGDVTGVFLVHRIAGHKFKVIDKSNVGTDFVLAIVANAYNRRSPAAMGALATQI